MKTQERKPDRFDDPTCEIEWVMCESNRDVRRVRQEKEERRERILKQRDYQIEGR